MDGGRGWKGRSGWGGLRRRVRNGEVGMKCEQWRRGKGRGKKEWV